MTQLIAVKEKNSISYQLSFLSISSVSLVAFSDVVLMSLCELIDEIKYV